MFIGMVVFELKEEECANVAGSQMLRIISVLS